ncbi:MFS transporter [Sphingomonas bacterium]|uniref:MFS transporter n=1 Tax=Sphingomonas bacterium TaxID=1895847 RepID=UPI001577366C|nr:MFS transporter [Sphingomonas bacterium]
MKGTEAPPVTGELRRGWRLLVASTAGMSVGSLHIHSLGAFMQPLQAEFGWPRSTIAGALTIVSIACVLLSAPTGIVVDRWGSRRIAIAGIITMCSGVAALSLAGPSIASWLMLWLIVALGVVMTNPTIWSAAITGVFDRHRGMALAIMLCGTALSSSTLPYLATTLIAREGWRLTYLILAGVWGAVALPLVLLFFFDRRGSPTPIVAELRAHAMPPEPGPAEAMRSATFIKLALAGLFLSMGLIGSSVHLIPILSDLGFARTTAAAIVSLAGPSAIVGRLGTGIMLDRIRTPLVAAVAVAVPILGFAILLSGALSMPAAIAATVLIGFGIGAELDTIAFLVARYFGLRHFGRLYGLIVALLGLASGVGPFLAGSAFDHYGSYRYWLLFAAPACAFASLMLATLGRYPAADVPAEAAR